MKILYGYYANDGYNNRQGLAKLELGHINRLINAGFDLKPFNMQISRSLPVLTFKQLDRRWKLRDKELMCMYNRFLSEIENCSVFYNSVGINFHPEFISSIPQFTVFGCNDDPESSEILSKPVASSYDMCAIGNIAEIQTYKSWGVKNVVWQPMGILDSLYDSNLTYEKILNGKRDIDLFMMIDKLSRPRRERMRLIERAFPDGNFYGRGWKKGFLEQGKEVEFLQRSKIGINIHNSTGPINSRLFYLPANGVLQICDNKNFLNEVFELNKEVIGFETIDECIDSCKYYLSHDHERREIAANGWLKAVTEYNEIAVFKRLIENINMFYNESKIKQSVSLGKPNLVTSICGSINNNYEKTITKLRRSASIVYRKIVRI